MSETFNEKMEREAKQVLGVTEADPHKPSMFLGVDAFRMWRMQRRVRKMARQFPLHPFPSGHGPYVGSNQGSHSHSIDGPPDPRRPEDRAGRTRPLDSGAEELF